MGYGLTNLSPRSKVRHLILVVPVAWVSNLIQGFLHLRHGTVLFISASVRSFVTALRRVT